MSRDAPRGAAPSGESLVVRALVALGLAGFVVGVFFAVAVGAGIALGLDGTRPGVTVVAAAVLAVAFARVRVRLAKLANRVVHGQRYTPWEAVSRLSVEMGREQAPEEVLASLAQVVRDGTGADRVVIWVRLGQALRPIESVPECPRGEPVAMSGELLPGLGADLTVPIRQGREILGAITVAGTPERRLRSIEVKLIEDLASAAWVVVRTVQLRASLQHRLDVARHQHVRLVEARARTAAAQLVERQWLERDIHDTCQQRAVVLAGKLGLVSRHASADPATALSILGEVEADLDRLADALTVITSGRGLPLLLGEGIGPALQAETADLPVRVDIHDETRCRFPPEVEEAVYSCCMEAVQNAVKHASASRVEVKLFHDAEQLAFGIRDDGIGFEPALDGSGTGLRNIQDRMTGVGGRLDVRSSAGGTTITGHVPIPARTLRS